MKFISTLPIVAAIVGLASASPIEARGGSAHQWQHSYNSWDSQHNKWVPNHCDNSGWDNVHKCCHSEEKCYWDEWDRSWNCCEASQWDWHNNCPTYYNNKRVDNQKKISYYGGDSAQCHQWYQNDCNTGHNWDYQHGSKYHPHH